MERERDRQTVRDGYRSFIFRALPLMKGCKWMTLQYMPLMHVKKKYQQQCA